jgi:hypothetical protein
VTGSAGRGRRLADNGYGNIALPDHNLRSRFSWRSLPRIHRSRAKRARAIPSVVISSAVHRRVPGSIAGGSERARMPRHPSQRDRDSRAIGIRWDRRRQQRPSTSRRYGSRAAVLPADRGRHAPDGNVRTHNGYDACSAASPSLTRFGIQPGAARGAENAFTRGSEVRYWNPKQTWAVAFADDNALHGKLRSITQPLC